MLYLKEANLEDCEKEYEAASQMPYYESGFGNSYYGLTLQQYRESAIPSMYRKSQGIGLPEDYVPETYFFLWDDDEIVGLFKIRHYLNDELREGAGHIGYGIVEKYRNRGYGTAGLKLAVEKAREIIREDEIYLAAFSYNAPSIKVMLNAGAVIVKEADGITYARIRIR